MKTSEEPSTEAEGRMGARPGHHNEHFTSLSVALVTLRAPTKRRVDASHQ
jgi:hypothetical protein